MAGAGGETLPSVGETGDFVVGERVFVPHVDRHYEAKILKAEFKRNADWPDGQWYYFLHYSGWNKKYDEWVEAPGLVKAAELGMATGTIGANGVTVGKSGASGAKKMPKERFAAATGAGGGKKNAARLAADLGAIGGAVVGGAAAPASGDAPGTAGAAAAPRGLQLELDISPVLKKALLDDHDAIVTDARLVPLPRSPCVAEVLRRYCEQATDSGSSGAVETEVATGLRAYFDKALMAVLLYRSERPQAMAMLADGRLPSSVYGIEHLLRLFVKLPDLLAAAGAGNMNEDMLVQTATAVQDLMNWVAEHLDTLLAPREAYLDYSEFMAGLRGAVAEQVAAAGFLGTNPTPRE